MPGSKGLELKINNFSEQAIYWIIFHLWQWGLFYMSFQARMANVCMRILAIIRYQLTSRDCDSNFIVALIRTRTIFSPGNGIKKRITPPVELGKKWPSEWLNPVFPCASIPRGKKPNCLKAFFYIFPFTLWIFCIGIFKKVSFLL